MSWETLKAITRKTIPMTFDERIKRLNWLIRGWTNDFQLSIIQQNIGQLNNSVSYNISMLEYYQQIRLS